MNTKLVAFVGRFALWLALATVLAGCGGFSSPDYSLVSTIEFSPDGKYLAIGTYPSANSNSSVQLWDVTNPKAAILTMPVTSLTRSLSFSPDGTTLASVHDDGKLLLWPTDHPVVTATILMLGQQFSHSLAYSLDGSLIVFAGSEGFTRAQPTAEPDRSLRIAQHNNGPESVRLPVDFSAAQLSFSADGKLVLGAGGESKKAVYIWQLDQPSSQPVIIEGDFKYVDGAAFNPRNHQIVLASFYRKEDPDAEDSLISLLDADHPAKLPVRQHIDGCSVRGLAVHPDGQQIALACHQGDTQIWQIDPTFNLIDDFKIGNGQVDTVAFSPNGQLLAVSELGGIVHLIDLSQPNGKRTDFAVP